MEQFARLVNILGTSTKTNDKLEALQEYFLHAPDKDKVWVIAIFSGRRPKRMVSSTLLSQWCIELVNIPVWLFEESYHTVGDLGETIALLLPDDAEKQTNGNEQSLSWYLETFIRMEKEDEAIKKSFILDCWKQFSRNEKFVFNKLITGGFRIGVNQKMMVNALAKSVNASASVIAHRISGNWDPASTSLNNLLNEESTFDISKPYPFYLSYALEGDISELGDIEDWQCEWKWDGIRGQIIKRDNELFVWSRGEELVTEKFPEYTAFKDALPDGIALDGEIICMAQNDDGSIRPLPFAILQTRIGRKNISKKQLT